jgi:transcriptional antiterminator
MSKSLYNDSKFPKCSAYYPIAPQTIYERIGSTLNSIGRQIDVLNQTSKERMEELITRTAKIGEKCKLLEQKNAQLAQELQAFKQNLTQQATPPTLEQHVWSSIVHAVRHPLTLIFLSCVFIYRLRTSTMV